MSFDSGAIYLHDIYNRNIKPRDRKPVGPWLIIALAIVLFMIFGK